MQHLRAQVGRVEAPCLVVEPHQVARAVEDHRAPLAGPLERCGEQIAGRARDARGLMDGDDRGMERGDAVEALHVGTRAARGGERLVAERRRGRHGEACSHRLRSFVRLAQGRANGDGLATSERRVWLEARAGCRDVGAQGPLMAAAAGADDGDRAQGARGGVEEADLRAGQGGGAAREGGDDHRRRRRRAGGPVRAREGDE